MNLNNKKIRKIVAIVILVLIVVMVAGMFLPYVAMS